MEKVRVGIVLGSDTDLPVMRGSGEVLDELGIKHEWVIASAHRTPDRVTRYAQEAPRRGIEVIIAGAGGAAHLPGVIASLTIIPVIGVPIKSPALSGVDSLYSIVQMPSGIPVAAMAIDGSKNAALYAAQILGLKDQSIMEKLVSYRRRLAEKVEAKSDKLARIGIEKYINGR